MPTTNELIKLYSLYKAQQEGKYSASDIQAYLYYGGKAERSKKKATTSALLGNPLAAVGNLAESQQFRTLQQETSQEAQLLSGARGPVVDPEAVGQEAALTEAEQLKKRKGYLSTIHAGSAMSGTLTKRPRLLGI